MVMGEAGREEYSKIQSFDAETQRLLKTALKGELRPDPFLSPLEQHLQADPAPSLCARPDSGRAWCVEG